MFQVRFFVLDEADRLMDNEDTIMKLFKRLPKGGAGLARLQVTQ
jgi:ATP-dependent RNA helicase DDX1